MYIRKKIFDDIFGTMTQNSAPNNSIRPDELMNELGIKKDAYYKDLNYLDITPEKDSEGKVYLTNEQANQIRALRNHVQITGNCNCFDNSLIVKVDGSNKIVFNNNESEENIYINREEPTAKIDSDIVREAKELAARGMAMNDLLKIQLASKMTFDDLDADLKEKVTIAREAANPKWTPASLADKILAQHRSQKA
ncbi:MAG: hypothetical protein AB4368_27935 [Xenococcaceae cyanobacterium]